MIFFAPFPLAILLLLLVLLGIFFFFFIQVEIVRIALRKLGLPPFAVFLVLLASLLGSGVNVPVYSRATSSFLLPGHPAPQGSGYRQAPRSADDGIIAVNVGGAVIPVLLCIYLLPKAPALPVISATLLSSLACHKMAAVVPGHGVTIPALIPPLIAILLAFIFSPKNKIPVAYISGVLGVLIGADLMNIPHLGTQPGVMSIGGAGVYDGIFLVGILSSLLA